MATPAACMALAARVPKRVVRLVSRELISRRRSASEPVRATPSRSKASTARRMRRAVCSSMGAPSASTGSAPVSRAARTRPSRALKRRYRRVSRSYASLCADSSGARASSSSSRSGQCVAEVSVLRTVRTRSSSSPERSRASTVLAIVGSASLEATASHSERWTAMPARTAGPMSSWRTAAKSGSPRSSVHGRAKTLVPGSATAVMAVGSVMGPSCHAPGAS